MSNVGMPSPLSGGAGDPASAVATAFVSARAAASAAEPSSRALDGGRKTAAAVAALVATEGSCDRCVIPKTIAAPPAATSARAGRSIRAMDMAVTIRNPRASSLAYQYGELILRRFVPVIKSA
jgi:hypothetical protein